jgi:putative cardiolipin synthase
VDAAAATARDGCSGIHALPIAQEAFAARAALARAAERSLDVQYYIWHGDTTGTLLLEKLWDAAERGVRVRLLLDDNGIAGMDRTIAAVNRNPNIEVRLFNPFKNRRFKPIGYLTDFRRLNRRLHNKSLTADSEATIVGGRNVGDEYFGAGQRMVFADLDVLAVGPVAREVQAAFNTYWNHESVVAAEAVVGKAGPNDVEQMLLAFAAVRHSPEAGCYLIAVRDTPLVLSLLAQNLAFEWVPVGLLCDPPDKVKGKAPDVDLVYDKLRQAFGSPQRGIDVISPDFVPDAETTRAFARFAQQGVVLRVITNSLAATDVIAVHAGYLKRRRPLLRSGVRLYELKPDVDDTGRAEYDARTPTLGSSSASLHAKTFSIDSARVFIGSLNLDPRSLRLNTEMGLLIESAALARTVAHAIDNLVPHAVYHVTLAGHRLEWVEPTAEGEIRYHREPRTRLLKRLAVGFVALLPIEWLL